MAGKVAHAFDLTDLGHTVGVAICSERPVSVRSVIYDPSLDCPQYRRFPSSPCVQ